MFVDSFSKADTLQWGKVKVMDNEECRQEEKYFYNGLLCAKTEYKQSTCSGDSGGPLVYYQQDGKLIQIGIVSFGDNRDKYCPLVVMNLFTRVSFFVEWIHKNIEM